MNLEALPNEILLVLFSCFNGFDLLQAFYNLNSRFNQLLYEKVYDYQFRFSSISKIKFDWICRQHLPSLDSRVTYLELSEVQTSPGQNQLFFSYFPSINHFIRLQTLKVSSIESSEMFITIVNALPYLSHLTYLQLDVSPSLKNNEIDFNIVLNNIWNLPQLLFCHLHMYNFVYNENNDINYSFTKQSTSIRHLELTGFCRKYSDIDVFFNQTPNLKHCNISVYNFQQEDYAPSFSLPKLSELRLQIFATAGLTTLFSFLKRLSNLRRLNIKLNSHIIDGHQWEDFIRKYLPKLTNFVFHMDNKFNLHGNMPLSLDQLFMSFRTPFWIDEHKWYVRCIKQGHHIEVYTLSSIVSNYRCYIPDVWFSTDSQDSLENYCNSVGLINCDRFFTRTLPSTLCLSNVDILITKLPLSDQFQSIIPHLNQLSYLRLLLDDETSLFDVQTLLDCTPKLYTFVIEQKKPLSLNRLLFTCSNPSIHTFRLEKYQYEFHNEECLQLAQSPLGQQCHFLNINVKFRQDIVILVEHMPNLQGLHAHVQESQDNNELIQWLQYQLPKTCYVAPPIQHLNDSIRIWIQ